jgi:hypothetical protein
MYDGNTLNILHTSPTFCKYYMCIRKLCKCLDAPALDDDIALPPSICTLLLGLSFRVRPGSARFDGNTLNLFHSKKYISLIVYVHVEALQTNGAVVW